MSPPRSLLAARAFVAVLGAAGTFCHADDATEAKLDALTQRIADQLREVDGLKRRLAEQEAAIEQSRRAIAEMRSSKAPPASAPTAAAASEPAVARVAPIFEQPGVLTPAGHGSLEPSLQYSYSSSNRLALVGYTVIPAILVGVIDVREVKRSTYTLALTGRYGISNRLEIEAKLPFVSRADASIGREFAEGAATDTSVFEATGRGLGDIEMTARYQLNATPADGSAIYVGSLRAKSRTGRDPFEVRTSTSVTGFSNEGVQRSLPTGSGFYSLQPALTVLLPSDPAVFFGSASYQYNKARKNVVRATDAGDEPLGTIQPGNIVGFNFGMGLSLNEKSSFSIGYDHASVGKTKQNGNVIPGSVRLQLGTLLLGLSHRIDDRRTVNLSLGAGLTRDSPDLTLTVRVPTAF